MIKVENLTRDFIKYEKQSGLKGMLKGVFNAKKVIKTAVDDVSFNINEGEIVGYIGANGAGKSTTIKILTGILVPTSGDVIVNGVIPHKKRVENAQNIGVVFGQRTQLWWDLPLTETFLILKEIYNVSDEDYKERMKFFNDILDIDSFIKSPVRTLSLGQRMRADIAASLLHNPKVLFLDEPTIGLDVVAKEKMRIAIKEMNQKFNTTVILTTHDLDDIEELCNRILIIDNGKIIYDGSINDIKSKYGYMKNIKFEIKDIEKFDQSINDYFKLDQKDFTANLDGNTLSIDFNKKKISVSDITKYIMDIFDVNDISINETKIEDIVKRIYQEGTNIL